MDATKEFVEEKDVDGTNMLPYVTVLICVTYKGDPIAGIINRPFVDDEPVMWGNVGGELHAVQVEFLLSGCFSPFEC